MSELEKKNLENCQENDVLRFEDEVCMISNLEDKLQDFFRSCSLNLANHLTSQLKIANSVRDRDMSYEEWFKKGKECEILKQGQNWQKGQVKVHLKIEFIPNQPEIVEENGHQETESPLDEIRQQLNNQTNS
jgi:hypothetical protein